MDSDPAKMPRVQRNPMMLENNEGTVIFRLSQKLNDKIKVGWMGPMPLDENPLADWSAQLFAVGRTQYILLSNTKALRSTVLVAKGITGGADFVELALGGIRDMLEADGHAAVYERIVVPACSSIFYAKALNRSVTGSMNDMIKHASYWLALGDVGMGEISARLKETPMSALGRVGSPYGFPRDVFEEIVAAAGP